MPVENEFRGCLRYYHDQIRTTRQIVLYPTELFL